MKKFIFCLAFAFISFGSFAQADKEIVVIRVEYAIKKTGLESRIFCDIGVANTHSLYRSMTNSENAVQIKDETDKIRVFTTEVDLMNYLFTLGYHFDSVFETEVVNSKYTNFILVKD